MFKNDVIEEIISNFKKKFCFLEIILKPGKKDGLFDGILEIVHEKRKSKFNIITRYNFNMADRMCLEYIRNQSHENNIILITGHVSAKMANILRNANIFFMDASANSYLKAEGIYIYNYDKSSFKSVPYKKAGSVFYSTGLKLIFNLLISNELLNDNYRKISEIADISLGSIGWIVHRLKAEGYIINTEHDKILVNKKEILKKWIENYPEKLRHKLIKGRYKFLNFESYKNWKNIVLSHPQSLWGGETAAEKTTGYLNAKIITIYSKEDHLELVKKLRLVPDNKGNVEILEMFWDPYYLSKNDETVPPLLAYADLMISENERNIEGAKIIYDKYLSQSFK